MKLYRTHCGAMLEKEDVFYDLPGVDWDSLLLHPHLFVHLQDLTQNLVPFSGTPQNRLEKINAPIGQQEVWAAGVTYKKSRSARMEEARSGGAANFYDRVYSASRPELFFKATPHRVAGPEEEVRIRSDSRWNVPEPELTLLLSPGGEILAYTIGNDMSSREIEGENPLYLPQAKVYDKSVSLGPCLFFPENGCIPPATTIQMRIHRNDACVFAGETTLASMGRSFEELIDYLYRDNCFPSGCFLMTGTGIVPPSSFTLASGDRIEITIPPIGTLVNTVTSRSSEKRRKHE